MTLASDWMEMAAELDAVVAELQAGLPSWIKAPLDERIAILGELGSVLGDPPSDLFSGILAAHRVDTSGHWSLEPWSILLCMVQEIRALERVLGAVARGRDPLSPDQVRTASSGQVIVDAFPRRWDERVLFADYSARVWLQPGVAVLPSRPQAAQQYSGAGFADPAVALLLAAGNVANLIVSDLMHLLFGQGCVVAVKLHPVLAHLRPALESAFAPFISRGWVRFVAESEQAGAYLSTHPGIDRIHMTGSAATYDKLMWGDGQQAQSRRRAGTPLVSKPFTAELGGVSPVIVVPGPWTRSDVRRQAELIVFAKLFNCGHVCAAPQVLVLPAGWPQADNLLDDIRMFLQSVPPREPHYPGSQAKVARAVADESNVEVLLAPNHRILVHDLDPQGEHSLFQEEVFADVLGVVRLPAPTLQAYLSEAVRLVNDRLAGTLAAHILVDPATARTQAPTMDRTVGDLRYGTVGINEWVIVSFLFGYLPWGAFPGHTPTAIGSGTGHVLNALMLADPQKTVITRSFRPRIRPLTSVANRSAGATTRRLLAYSASDDLRRLPAVMASALRG